MIKNFAFLLALGAGGSAFASTYLDVSPCVEDTLANYMLSGPCSIGALTYSNFDFAAIGTPGLITASRITVRPDGLNSFTLLPGILTASEIAADPTNNFDVFNRTFTQVERYFFSWFIDPPPIIGGDELFLDPPIATSPVIGSKWGCSGTDSPSYFTDSNASAVAALGALTPLSPGVYDPAQYEAAFGCVAYGLREESILSDPYFLRAESATFLDTITFPNGVAFIDVRLVLDFGPGTVNNFSGVQGDIPLTIPEPATNAMIAAGLVALIGLSKKKFKR